MARHDTHAGKSGSGGKRPPMDADEVERTVERQRAIQANVDREDAKQAAKDARSKSGKQQHKQPTQAGLEKQPENPLPAQHLRKPGNEHELDLQPRFLAEQYRGSGKLEGMVALVTGGDSGIGRAVAVLFAREGADVAIAYLAEHEDAEETRRCVENEGRRCLVIAGDVRRSEFCNAAVQRVVDEFGKLDILVNNAAFQQHGASLEDITDE
jgi:hypothetical protein